MIKQLEKIINQINIFTPEEKNEILIKSSNIDISIEKFRVIMSKLKIICPKINEIDYRSFSTDNTLMFHTHSSKVVQNYFKRDGYIEKIKEKFNENQKVVITAMSGTGKS